MGNEAEERMKDGVLTTSTEHGYYWYRDKGWDWTIYLVFKDVMNINHLMARGFAGDDIELTDLKGQWGPKIEPPKENN